MDSFLIYFNTVNVTLWDNMKKDPPCLKSKEVQETPSNILRTLQFTRHMWIAQSKRTLQKFNRDNPKNRLVILLNIPNSNSFTYECENK